MDTIEDPILESSTPSNGVDESIKRRMSKISGQRRDALAQVADLEAVNLELEKRVATSQALAGRIAELEAQLSAQHTSHSRGMSLVDAGVHDAEARDYLLHRYRKAGEDAPEFSDWLTSQRESATGFLAEVFNRSPTPEATTPAPQEEPAPGVTGKPAPAINRGTRAAPTGPDGLSVDAILDPGRSFEDIKAAMGLTLDPRSRKR